MTKLFILKKNYFFYYFFAFFSFLCYLKSIVHNIAIKLKDIMDTRSISANTLWEFSGVSLTTIYKAQKGILPKKRRTLYDILNALNEIAKKKFTLEDVFGIDSFDKKNKLFEDKIKSV